jgi:recombination protein RecR
MAFPPRAERLVRALTVLPGVGRKSAQRMALFLLTRAQSEARILGEALLDAVAHVRRCEQCRMLSEATHCELCIDATRDTRLLCVVESEADVMAIEKSGVYKGLYHVLGGRLSPLDGIGPQALGLHHLEARLKRGGVTELILALSSTIEGQATQHYLTDMCRTSGVPVSRLAQGMPVGGELEYLDEGTLVQALSGRHRAECL